MECDSTLRNAISSTDKVVAEIKRVADNTVSQLYQKYWRKTHQNSLYLPTLVRYISITNNTYQLFHWRLQMQTLQLSMLDFSGVKVTLRSSKSRTLDKYLKITHMTCLQIFLYQGENNVENCPQVAFVLLGDEAFGLISTWCSPTHIKDCPKKIYNYRHCRVIECPFGILSDKWRILHSCMLVNTSWFFYHRGSNGNKPVVLCIILCDKEVLIWGYFNLFISRNAGVGYCRRHIKRDQCKRRFLSVFGAFFDKIDVYKGVQSASSCYLSLLSAYHPHFKLTIMKVVK